MMKPSPRYELPLNYLIILEIPRQSISKRTRYGPERGTEMFVLSAGHLDEFVEFFQEELGPPDVREPDRYPDRVQQTLDQLADLGKFLEQPVADRLVVAVEILGIATRCAQIQVVSGLSTGTHGYRSLCEIRTE